MIIRNAVTEDAESLLGIYSYYVEKTAVSFEYEAPSVQEFRNRIANTIKKYPYIVIEEDGEIKGYAYAGVFKGRAAYDHCCEVWSTGQKEKVIADPISEDEYLTRNSEHFHQHMGYTKVGEFHKCGYKFGRLYNMIWMEKIIGEKQ